jgi:hypothetical protein
MLLVIGAAIDIQNLFHGRHELGIGLRRNHPANLPPGLEFVFLSVLRTVSAEMAGT